VPDGRRIPPAIDYVEASGDGYQHEDDHGGDDHEAGYRAHTEQMHNFKVRSIALEIKCFA